MNKGQKEVKEQDFWANDFQGRKQSKYKSPEAEICLSVLGTTERPGCQSGEDEVRDKRGRDDPDG